LALDLDMQIWDRGAEGLNELARRVETAPASLRRSRFLSEEDGRYAFVAVRPTPYPIPFDGPVGEMLEATGRHPWRPAHIHIAVRADGYEPLVTHIFDSDSDYLDSDAVFAVKQSLISVFTPRAANDPARPDGVYGRWYSVENDIVLAPATEDG
jgi:catechol 1,2-dioxygenase